MKIDLELVEKLEKLSSIRYDDKGDIIRELNRVVEYIDKINELKVDDIPITVQPYKIENYLRDDIWIESNSEEVLQESNIKDGYISVPNIL